MRRWPSLLLTVFIITGFSIYLSRDLLAPVVWEKYRLSRAAIFLNKNNPQLAMAIGGYHYNGVAGGGEYNIDIAQKAYEKAVAIEPGILWGHYQLARIYFVKSNFIRALEEINKELEANPENLRALYIRGLIYGYRGQTGDLEKAEDDFRRFTEWAPSEWAGYNDLVWILFKEEKYAQAEKEMGRALSNVPEADQNPWLWNALGVAELNLGKYSRAATSFKRAKEQAEKLTTEEWLKSYPGNDPVTGGEGLSAFLEAINENLRRTESFI